VDKGSQRELGGTAQVVE